MPSAKDQNVTLAFPSAYELIIGGYHLGLEELDLRIGEDTALCSGFQERCTELYEPELSLAKPQSTWGHLICCIFKPIWFMLPVNCRHVPFELRMQCMDKNFQP